MEWQMEPHPEVANAGEEETDWSHRPEDANFQGVCLRDRHGKVAKVRPLGHNAPYNLKAGRGDVTVDGVKAEAGESQDQLRGSEAGTVANEKVGSPGLE
eukprot:1415615-Alexandrium_andersonii.AAC.1